MIFNKMLSFHTLTLTVYMLIEEEPKIVGEINPDALEAVFTDEGDTVVEEDIVITFNSDEDGDELDIPFTDDGDDW